MKQLMMPVITALCLVFIHCSPVYDHLAVSATDLTAYLETPQRGADVPSDIDHPQFSGRIVWQDSENRTFTSLNFGSNAAYTAVITLTAKDGYNFIGVQSDVFTHDYSMEVSNSGGVSEVIVVTVAFKETAGDNDNQINYFDLGGLIAPPVRGRQPQEDIPDHVQYRSDLAWLNADGTVFTGGLFAPAAVYMAKVTINPQPGWTLEGLINDNSFTYTGAQTTAELYRSRTVIITFEMTAADGQPNRVNDLNLSSKLMLLPNEEAAQSFTSEQYNGTAQWFRISDDGSETAHSGDFSYFTRYRVDITLTANTDYTFAGISANAFSHNSARMLEHQSGGSGSLVINIIFWKTQANLTDVNWNSWNTTVKACCYTGGYESPANLIDGNVGTRWAYGWGGALNTTDWPRIYFGDWLNDTECGNGHLSLLEIFGFEPAHSFTIDMGAVRNNLINLQFYPSHEARNPIGEWEIYISDTVDIGPLVSPDRLPEGVRYLGTDRFVVNNFQQWYTTDLTRFSANEEPISGRYLHIRVTDLFPTHWYWLSVQIGELRLQVHSD